MDGCQTWLPEDTRFNDFKLILRYAADDVDVPALVDTLKSKAQTFTVGASNKQAATLLGVDEGRVQESVDIVYARNDGGQWNMVVQVPADETDPEKPVH